MINIKSNETKILKFGISVAGIQSRDLKGALRLTIEEIEYGFPINIVNGKVVAKIPPLKDSMITSKIAEHKRYDIKLELIANDTYIVPWTDVAKIKTPVSVKVNKSTEENETEIEKVKVEVNNIDEENKKEKSPVIKKKQVKKVIENTKFSKFMVKK